MSQTTWLQRQTRSNNKRSKRLHHHPFNSPTPNHNRCFGKLPDDVVENIFSFLPIKKAVRIGVVSSRFKNSWALCRRLIFDRAFATKVGTRTKFVKVVNGVFETHEAPQILTLQLFFDHSDAGNEAAVRRWVETAVEKGVEELDLEFFVSGGDFVVEPFRFPTDFFDIQTLRTLRLVYCDVDFPRWPNGLRFLTTVVLRKVVLVDGNVERLVVNCLGLESLDMAQCYGPRRLRIWASKLNKFKELRIGAYKDLLRIDIDSPSLRTLYYRGQGRILTFNHSVSNLDDVVLSLTPSRSFPKCHGKVESLVSRHLRNVTVLTATSTLLEGLIATRNHEMTMVRDYQPSTWNKLKELQLFMEASSFCNLVDVASFLERYCTNIEKLFIDLNDFFQSGIYCQLHHMRALLDPTKKFGSLRFIKIRGFNFRKHEIGLVKFLLEKSLVLEELVLVFPKKDDLVTVSPTDASVYGRLFHSWKQSSEAAILVHEHLHDDQTCTPMHSKIWY